MVAYSIPVRKVEAADSFKIFPQILTMIQVVCSSQTWFIFGPLKAQTNVVFLVVPLLRM